MCHLRKATGLLVIAAMIVALISVQTPLAHAAGPLQLTSAPNGVMDFQLSPDGKWAVYSRFVTGEWAVQLESVALTGGVPHHLADVVLRVSRSYGNPRDAYRISPDSQRVVFFGQPVAAPTSGSVAYPGYGLHSVPIDGSASAQVLADDPHVHRFQFAPDGQSVIYTTGSDVELGFTSQSYQFELYQVPVTGGSPQRVNIALTPGLSVAFDRWAVMSSGYVAYVVGSLSYMSERSFGTPDLYAVPLGAAPDQAVKLNPCGGNSLLSGLTFASSRVVFSSIDCEPGNVIRAVAPDGSHGVRVSPTGMTWYLENLIVSEDESHVAFVYRENGNPQPHRNLFIAPIDGPESEIHLVREGDPAGVNPVLMALSPDGAWLTYLPSTVSGLVDLHLAARFDATNASQVLGQVHYSSIIPGILFSHDGRYLIFASASLDLSSPGAPPVPLGIGVAPPGLYGNAAQIDSNSRFLVTTDGGGNVASVPVHGPASAVATLSHVPIALYTDALLTFDGSQVVYISSVNEQLYITQVDPNAPPPTATPTATAVVSPSPTAAPTATQTPGEMHPKVFLPALSR